MAPIAETHTGSTINQRIAESIGMFPERPALSSKAAKVWATITYAELGERVRQFSMGLRSLGVVRGDRVALISENRPEWVIVDLAILAAGAVNVPIYPSLPASQVSHILSDSGSTVVVASDTKQMQKVLSSRANCPALKHLITLDSAAAKVDVVSYDSIASAGKEFVADETFEQRRDSVMPSDLASLVYTSGTTGDPKGAMLSHQNLSSAAGMADDWFPVDEHEVFLSFLPLCHVFERVTYYLSVSIGAHTYYAESIFKVQENLADTKPTVMQSVPRLYESIHERTLDAVAKQEPNKQKVFHWAIATGVKRARRINARRYVGPLLDIQYRIADKLVLSKIRERLGGKIRFFVSGGAPISDSTAEFFHAIDMPVLEGYGLTETTAALTCNAFYHAKVGTVGQAMGGVTLKIADDGEILAQGPTVMQSYWNNPDAGAAIFNADGWFQTGDIGVIDQQGYLKITDRKKDIIVLANGKNVAPQPIEAVLKHSPLIADIVLLGDRSGNIGALVVPQFDKLKEWAKSQSIETNDNVELAGRPESKKKIKSEIDALSSEFADFEKVRKLALLDHALSIEAGELTPTLKVRRKVIFERYGTLLD